MKWCEGLYPSQGYAALSGLEGADIQSLSRSLALKIQRQRGTPERAA
ncbi:MAG: hypothetical protein RIE59_17175 [Imperialibacter sp.]